MSKSPPGPAFMRRAVAPTPKLREFAVTVTPSGSVILPMAREPVSTASGPCTATFFSARVPGPFLMKPPVPVSVAPVMTRSSAARVSIRLIVTLVSPEPRAPPTVALMACETFWVDSDWLVIGPVRLRVFAPRLTVPVNGLAAVTLPRVSPAKDWSKPLRSRVALPEPPRVTVVFVSIPLVAPTMAVSVTVRVFQPLPPPA